MTKFSDNPSPSLLMQEHVDPSNPAAGYQRLFVDTDHILKMVDSSGTVTTFGTGLADPMTTRGDIIVRNASNVTARLAIGSSGKVLSSDGTDVSWQTPAGGGLTQSFIGYNTAGGSWETLTGNRAYWKKVTLSATSHFRSIDVHLRPHVDNVTAVNVMIAADNSTAPGQLLAATSMPTGGVYLNNSSSVDTNARWLSIPIGATLTAADYWIGFMGQNGNIAVAYDGSGSDQYFTSSLFTATGAYPSAWAITTSANKYSIRASILS